MFKRRIWPLLFVALLVVMSCSATLKTTASAAPAATVAYFSLTPESGPPGTVAQLTGGQTYTHDVRIYVNRNDTLRIGARNTPLAVAHPDKNGNWTATITIPNSWPNGDAMLSGTIYIAAVDVDVHPFHVEAVGMPVTGRNEGEKWLGLGLLGLLLVAIGAWLSRTL